MIKVFSQKVRYLSEEGVLHAKGRRKLLNKGHVGRYNDHHQLIMNLERIRNHDIHIMYTLHLLSFVLRTLRSIPVARMCCENIHPSSKLLITMDLVSLIMIPSLTCPVINASLSTCILFSSRVYASSVTFPASPKFLVVENPIAISCVTNRFMKDYHVCSVLNLPRTHNKHALHHGDILEHK
jgi:hypothetical protein